VSGADAEFLPSIAFRQAMLTMTDRCCRLRSAINRQDWEGVEYAAQHAVNAWLAGRTACGQILQQMNEPSPYAEAACRLLESNYMSLLELFAQATKTLHVPEMWEALRDLRGTLMSAMAQPFVRSTPIRVPVLRTTVR
jgi:hypothetical protein